MKKDLNTYHRSVKSGVYAALAVAFIPHLADYAFTAIQLTLYTQGVYEFFSAAVSALNNEGVMWMGVPELKYGAIITGMLWASITAFVIDKRLDKAGFVGLAAICFVFNAFKKSFTVPEDFDYV